MKIIILSIVTITLLHSNDSFSMLTRTSSIIKTRTSFIQLRNYDTSPEDQVKMKRMIDSFMKQFKPYKHPTISPNLNKRLEETAAKNIALMEKISRQNKIIIELNETDYTFPILVKDGDPKLDKLLDEFEKLEKEIRE